MHVFLRVFIEPKLMFVRWSFSGILTFAYLRHLKCLTEPDMSFDMEIVCIPFDTRVSYRPGQLYFVFKRGRVLLGNGEDLCL